MTRKRQSKSAGAKKGGAKQKKLALKAKAKTKAKVKRTKAAPGGLPTSKPGRRPQVGSVVLAAEYDYSDRRKLPVISLGVLESVVGDLVNVAVGVGSYRRVVIVPIAAIHKADKLTEQLHTRMLELAAHAWHLGFEAGQPVLPAAGTLTSIGAAAITVDGLGITATSNSLRVVETAEDVVESVHAEEETEAEKLQIIKDVIGAHSYSGPVSIPVDTQLTPADH